MYKTGFLKAFIDKRIMTKINFEKILKEIKKLNKIEGHLKF